MKRKTHYLKTWSRYFHDIDCGLKDFELRKNDRNFKVGDILILGEIDEFSLLSTGKAIKKTIKYILEGGEFGLHSDYVILGMS